MRGFVLIMIITGCALCAKEVTVYPFPWPTTHEFVDPFPLESTQLALSKLSNQIIERSRTLEARLKLKIFGQDEAVKETAHSILRFAAGVNDPYMPIACLLYCGPSGVGKTELAKQLCLELYGKEAHFFRINMSEFSEANSISRLIGAPPAYVGYETGGSLSNRLRDNPYCVVLLDEVEKAHPKVLKLFMHIFDAGYFTSSQGQDVDCTKTIFILTSNIAALEIAELFRMGLPTQEILNMLQPYLMEVLSPEMYNRLDCLIFSPLSEELLEKLILKMLDELKCRVSKSKGIEICFDPSVIEHLKGYSLDPTLGARPLKRAIEKELTTILATAIIDHSFKKGDVLFCSYFNGQIFLDLILTLDE